jgi:pyrroline-5-carboxylate reductase
LDNSHIAFIGAGNMAGSLIHGLRSKGVAPDHLLACDIDPARLQQLHEECGITTGSLAEVCAQADVIVLATKPQVLKAVCEELAPLLRARRCLVISIAAGIPLDSLQQWLGAETALVRCMPNTPALVSIGATGLFANAFASPAQKQLAENILEAVGVVCWLPQEADIGAVTALSGSGPAYYFLLMEAMIAAGTRMGLSQETAQRLTLQTALGAATLAMQSDVPPAELRRRVTSPGGTTEQAIRTFERLGFTAIVAEAMHAAQRRSDELAESFS